MTVLTASYLGPAPVREWKDKLTGELRRMERWAVLVKSDTGIIPLIVIRPKGIETVPTQGAQIQFDVRDRDGQIELFVSGVLNPQPK